MSPRYNSQNISDDALMVLLKLSIALEIHGCFIRHDVQILVRENEIYIFKISHYI